MVALSSKNLVSLEGITKLFNEPTVNPFRKRGKVPALVSVDLEIPEGAITCLLGPNGAGKTTLIKIISCLVTPDSGTIRYRDKTLDSSGKGILGKIGLVTPNERSFYWRLTGKENLLFFGSLHGLRGSALRERVDSVVEESGIGASADRPYRLYSSGMKQKLNIARALLGAPELFLLDEPAAHLDPLARQEFQNFILNDLILKRRATVFLCTHDLDEARRLANHIVVLDKGRVVAKGTQDELGGYIDERLELIIRFAGTLPPVWISRWGESLSHEDSNTIRILLDPYKSEQEAALRDFVMEGGILLEAYRAGDPLLRLLHRKVGSR